MGRTPSASSDDAVASRYGYLLSRLRKTHKALWYAKHKAISAASRSAHPRGHGGIRLPSLRHLHEQTGRRLNDALTSVQNALVTPDDEAIGTQIRLACNLTSCRRGTRVLSGEQDVWLPAAAASQIPFAHRGRAMPKPFWGCLNAATPSSPRASCQPSSRS